MWIVIVALPPTSKHTLLLLVTLLKVQDIVLVIIQYGVTEKLNKNKIKKKKKQCGVALQNVSF